MRGKRGETVVPSIGGMHINHPPRPESEAEEKPPEKRDDLC